jgi:hypothetical protein
MRRSLIARNSNEHPTSTHHLFDAKRCDRSFWHSRRGLVLLHPSHRQQPNACTVLPAAVVLRTSSRPPPCSAVSPGPLRGAGRGAAGGAIIPATPDAAPPSVRQSAVWRALRAMVQPVPMVPAISNRIRDDVMRITGLTIGAIAALLASCTPHHRQQRIRPLHRLPRQTRAPYHQEISSGM